MAMKYSTTGIERVLAELLEVGHRFKHRPHVAEKGENMNGGNGLHDIVGVEAEPESEDAPSRPSDFVELQELVFGQPALRGKRLLCRGGLAGTACADARRQGRRKRESPR